MYWLQSCRRRRLETGTGSLLGLILSVKNPNPLCKPCVSSHTCFPPPQALPLLVSDQSDSLQFDAGLQQLYAAVLSHGSSRKRKLSEDPSVEETPVDEPDATSSLGASKADSGAAEEVQLEAAGAKMADRATERKSLPSAPAARPPAKPKKKKVGLFR
ncbi:non-homologous end-joining factor 1 [Pseudochaenichthys georgianus]|uniref:non-homologous end-joining factor 1 n=1 Tax=Pseudochaenichthys georgianus TaxID=52239 RepID=UPI0039C1717F